MRRLLLPLLVIAGTSPAFAEEPPTLRPPVVDAIAIDGRLDEPAWKDALKLPTAKVDVPDPLVDAGSRTMTPELRAVVQAGQLCLAASCAEPPGTGCGLLVFVGRADDHSAGHAWSLSYRPLNPRVSRYIVRTGSGVGRKHCALTGAIDVSQVDRWTAELRVPLADVGANPTDALRIAAVVCTRTPTLFSASPPDAAWRGLQHWFLLNAPDGGWSNAGVPSDGALAAEGFADEEAAKAWDQVLQRTHEPLDPEPSVLDRDERDLKLLEPAAALLKLRRDLTPVIQTILGDLFERAGALEAARKAYDAALSVAPGWSEARFGRDVRLHARRLLSTPGREGMTTDYVYAYEQIAAAAAVTAGWERHGWDLAEGLLRARGCEFPAAVMKLEPIARMFPGEEWPQIRLERAKKEVQLHALELLQRQREAQDRFPRVKLKTSRGDIVVELFEKVVPNAVNQFVWLVEKGFYDGTRVHHAVPFSHAAMGDPNSRTEAKLDEAGLGGPGYEIRIRPSKRRPYRGSIAFPLAKQNLRTAGSNFVLLTGLAMNADTLATFGSIVEGQDVADALRAGDRIESASVVRKTESWTYRPIGMDGRPAPEPK